MLIHRTPNPHLTLNHIADLADAAALFNKSFIALFEKQQAELNSNDDRCNVELSEVKRKYDEACIAAGNELKYRILIDGATESLAAAADEYKDTSKAVLKRWYDTRKSDAEMHRKEVEELMDNHHRDRLIIGEKHGFKIPNDQYIANVRRHHANSSDAVRRPG